MAGQTSQYLESKVLTAPPQRLHLMLIEGALRFGRQAEQSLRGGDSHSASAPLLRVIDIVGELLAGVRQQHDEVNKRLADFYWFLFRRFSEAKIHFDAGKLTEALKLLEYERETWQMACEKAAQAETAAPVLNHPAAPAQTSKRSEPMPRSPRAGGFSFESLAALRSNSGRSTTRPDGRQLTHYVRRRYHSGNDSDQPRSAA